MCFSFFELALLNFWVDEPQEISTDVVALKPMSQTFVLLIFLKNLLRFHKKCSIVDLYLTDSDERLSFQRCFFLMFELSIK